MELPLDYETLKIIWWGLVGILLVGFAATDGYDLGTATLLPFVAKTDRERRLVINAIAPTWEGHQVWFITAGGAWFAAWPFVYAISFSGFYLAMFVVLAALILRPVGFKYRSKLESTRWRSSWDWALFVGGAVPALIFGVALGNVLQGVPFSIDSTLRASYEGGLLGLLNPFALVAGLVSVAMLVMHGATYLGTKIEHGTVLDRATTIGRWAAIAMIVLYAVAGVWLALGIAGFRIEGAIDVGGPANPLRKDVSIAVGAWMDNYSRYPWMVLHPAKHENARRQPDSMGLLLQPPHPVHHAGRGHRLSANRASLHLVGDQGPVGPGHNGRGQFPRTLLTGAARHVVFQLDPGARVCPHLWHSQRNVE
jgi:cytochrome d ubiquinol oxidase subunit II